MPPRPAKAQKNCSDDRGVRQRPVAAPAQKASLRRRISAKTWASGKFSSPSRALNSGVRRPQERVGRPLEVEPRRHRRAAHLPHRRDLRRARAQRRVVARRPTARSACCSRRIRARNRPASSSGSAASVRQARPHLLRRPLEQPAAAHHHQAVGREERLRLGEVVGDVPDRVPGHVDDLAPTLSPSATVSPPGQREVERRQPARGPPPRPRPSRRSACAQRARPRRCGRRGGG